MWVSVLKRRINLSIFFSGAFLYAANEFIKMRTSGLIGYLLRCHFNDFIAGLIIVAYSNYVISLSKYNSIDGLKDIVFFSSVCGLFWEGVAPLFLRYSVSDPVDIVAYVLGSVLYYYIKKMIVSKSGSDLMALMYEKLNF